MNLTERAKAELLVNPLVVWVDKRRGDGWSEVQIRTELLAAVFGVLDTIYRAEEATWLSGTTGCE